MRTLTAMFDSRADAENARDRLATASVSNDNVTILDQTSLGDNDTTSMRSGTSTGMTGSSDTTHGHRSLWQEFKALFSDDESSYEEGLRRGGYLLTARVDDDQVDRAIDILDDEGTVDLDQRTSAWRNEGWTGDRNEGLTGTTGGTRGDTTAGAAAGGVGSALRAGVDKLTGNDDRRTTGDRDNLTDSGETRIPVVEEQLRVGKREVARGGVRVRSYIVEEPVHESVRLREEHVTVDRRPVSGESNPNAGDLLRERTVEVTETAEEAVIDKRAHVREEVVVGKTVDERVQEVNDTVRRTQVDVEQLGREDRTGDTRTGGNDSLRSDRDDDLRTGRDDDLTRR